MNPPDPARDPAKQRDAWARKAVHLAEQIRECATSGQTNLARTLLPAFDRAQAQARRWERILKGLPVEHRIGKPGP